MERNFGNAIAAQVLAIRRGQILELAAGVEIVGLTEEVERTARVGLRVQAAEKFHAVN